LGDFNFEEIETANRVLGPIFFLTYVFFVFFVLLNMFIAIINDTYGEIKEEMRNQKSEIELGAFFKKGYNKVLDKLNIKRAQIIDIQKAVATADLNHDGKIDYIEFRNNLRVRTFFIIRNFFLLKFILKYLKTRRRRATETLRLRLCSPSTTWTAIRS
jgi:polycystin 2